MVGWRELRDYEEDNEITKLTNLMVPIKNLVQSTEASPDGENYKYLIAGIISIIYYYPF